MTPAGKGPERARARSAGPALKGAAGPAPKTSAGSAGGAGSGARRTGSQAVPPAPAQGGGALAARIAGYVLLGVLGVVVGIAGALVQGGWFPGGLALALLGQMALCYGGVHATGTRLGGVVPAATWAIVVLFLTATRPEGDFVFSVGIGSYVFLLGGMVAGVMCATMPKLPQPGSTGVRLGK